MRQEKHLSFGNIVYSDIVQEDRERIKFKTNPNACIQLKLSNDIVDTPTIDCESDFNNKPIDECITLDNDNSACYIKANSKGEVNVKLPHKIDNGVYDITIHSNNLLRKDVIEYNIEGVLEIVHLTKELTFNNLKLSEEPNTIYNRTKGNVINVKINDDRSEKTGWRLSVYLNSPLSKLNEPSINLPNAMIYKFGNTQKTLKVGATNKILVAETEGDYDTEINLTFSEDQGILINIDNYAKVFTDTPYNTDLVWLLEAKLP